MILDGDIFVICIQAVIKNDRDYNLDVGLVYITYRHNFETGLQIKKIEEFKRDETTLDLI
jgi:hypothetical protein